MNLLFAIDDRVVDQLLTVLYSIKRNTSATSFSVYVIQDKKLTHTQRIIQVCKRLKMTYHPIIVSNTHFDKAPVTDRYPKTIYYRLLAYEYLPKNLKRVLYLDTDVLVINDLKKLYNMDFDGYWYAAASHIALDVTDSLNKIRLGNFDTDGYYNSGVILMNLPEEREHVKAEDIYGYIRIKNLALFLPDQDILNGLYGQHIKKIPDEIYNYDARMNPLYYTKSNGVWDIDWVIEHTSILHFCGRDKPWKPDYKERFSGLYKHYAHVAKSLH
ncbi:General stress protein A [Companilactobacillus paralimentarius]|jgi:Lipopolysaccharide biosynthesis proteins, LPS:glycosyltransferases|uniref:glycosyltransferase family 8 protein n=1 Tax=Companilactobacillus paralimentarius TaxID=83526 RepID=UPI00384C3EBB